MLYEGDFGFNKTNCTLYPFRCSHSIQSKVLYSAPPVNKESITIKTFILFKAYLTDFILLPDAECLGLGSFGQGASLWLFM
jgi:hypothetical protein